MDYSQYIRHQTEGVGMVKKPLHYRRGERRAIEYFFQNIHKCHYVLDVGCGSGTGIVHLKDLGFINVRGIDINPLKIEMCRRKGLDVFCGDVERIRFPEKYDIVWSSHSFEHMLNPSQVIENLKAMTKKTAQFFFILPYVDTGPKEVHCASDEIGTRIDDNGKSVVEWFAGHGLETTEIKFDDYREKEIWLKMRKEE